MILNLRPTLFYTQAIEYCSGRNTHKPDIACRSSGCSIFVSHLARSSMRMLVSAQAGSTDEDSNYWTKMMSVIRGEIQEYRSELDALTMKRTQMERKLKEVWIVLLRKTQSMPGLAPRVPRVPRINLSRSFHGMYQPVLVVSRWDPSCLTDNGRRKRKQVNTIPTTMYPCAQFAPYRMTFLRFF